MKKIYFEEIPSTQIYAKEKAKLGIKNEIYIAKKQSSGIGRNGHEWISIEGGLYFSFITDIYNNIYTLTIGAAVYKALEELYGIKAKIKWPNDILVNDKKIAGIICEKIQDLVVVGIGINTNIEELKGLSDIATTLKLSFNIECDNDILLEQIMKNIKELNDKREVLSIFRDNMAYLNEKRFISQISKEATINGIDDNGYLIVKDNFNEYKINGGTI